MANGPLASGIVPAQLGFLAIYNPSLGATDETIDAQIVYYASAGTQSSAKRRRQHRAAMDDGRPTDSLSKEERNERLRQIGLAQGMVAFARSFSGGIAVDSIDTERTRVVLHELEPGWWILASIDLTRLPLPPNKVTPPPPSPPPPPPSSSSPSASPSQKFEYSSREVKPAVLLLQDLLRAHSLFLLHHGPSLSALFTSVPRPRFTALLARYWGSFSSAWNVLLHGNPACSVFGGVKIAACGELGIGVGEEDRGSGEREVLEGLVERFAGLVDLVVGRFGGQNIELGREKEQVNEAQGRWLGTGNDVDAEDGAVFLGVGALSRRSLRAVACWMGDIYTWGESAYGVAESPTGTGPRAKRRKAAGKKAGAGQESPAGDAKDEERKAKAVSAGPGTSGDVRPKDPKAQPLPATPENAPGETGDSGGMDKMLSYLKLGYGTYWSLGVSSPITNTEADDESAINPAGAARTAAPRNTLEDPRAGRFLIGLDRHDTESQPPGSPRDEDVKRNYTVTVELETGADHPQDERVADTGYTVQVAPAPNCQRRKKSKTENLRPVVYVRRPFIFILLFRPDTPSPPWEELSESLHTQLSPLHKPLLASTAYRPEKPSVGRSAAGAQDEIYDLVFDPHSITIHSTIPNIPEPVLVTVDHPSILPPPPQSQPAPPAWTRLEALNTHNQIVNMFASTRGDLSSAQERTCKTSRGWWIVWNRIFERSSSDRLSPPGKTAPFAGESGLTREDEDTDPDGETDRREDSYAEQEGEQEQDTVVVGKEIFLVRKASDHGGVGVRGASASYVGAGGGAGGWADGASRLAQGIGVDTRRYIEGLLSLNR